MEMLKDDKQLSFTKRENFIKEFIKNFKMDEIPSSFYSTQFKI